jgi:N6-adenosine-specific RNA methylase IME4
MSTEDIKALPVKDIADDNCILFMWVTPPHIKEGLDVIEAWGFQYKTFAFTWVKLNKKQPTLFMGCGSWTRANSEICLLATKGKPKRVSASVRQVILSPREEHSKKPDEARERIIELVGDLPRIELFARQQVTGWDCWGDEIPEEVISW